MMNILFVDTMHPLLIDSLRESGYNCVEGYSFSYQEILEMIDQYQGVIIRSRITLDENILSKATKLQFIARGGAGMENIDIAFAKSKGVACLNSPEGNRDAVGEHALGMLLSLMNNLHRADRQVREGEWLREPNRGHELNGKTVALIGCGNMGSTFAQKLSGIGCEIIAYDKYRSGFGTSYLREVDMEEIFEKADILSLHVPLSEETEYLVNHDYINLFRKNIYLVNTARGKCVRLSDVVKNLKSGKLVGVCLDVLEYEDLSFEKFSVENLAHTNPDWKFLVESDRVILTPHIAGWTFESLEKIALVLLEKIQTVIKYRE